MSGALALFTISRALIVLGFLDWAVLVGTTIAAMVMVDGRRVRGEGGFPPLRLITFVIPFGLFQWLGVVQERALASGDSPMFRVASACRVSFMAFGLLWALTLLSFMGRFFVR